MRRVVTGLGALTVLAILLAGVPYALLVFFGSPLPGEMPDTDTLTGQMGPGTIIKVLVALVWLAWIHFAFCVLVEVYAAIRGAHASRVPFAKATQPLAHRLVVAALLLFTVTTAFAPGFMKSATSGPPAKPEGTHSSVQQPSPPAAQTESASEVFANVGAQLETKEETRKVYRVRPPEGRHHESLWEIAEKCLGEGRRYKEIYELNKHKKQPDGTRLHIASLIRPGWVLDMPDDAVNVEVERPRSKRAEAQIGEQAAVKKALQAEKAEADAKDAEKKAGRPLAREEQLPEITPAPVSPPSATEPPSARPTQETGIDWDWQKGLAAGSLLAAGLLAALGRKRREQLWLRAFGNRLPKPEGDAVLAEQTLRLSADHEAARRLDESLRQMSVALAQQGRIPPTVNAVFVGEDATDLWLRDPDRDPPAPWEALDEGQVWRLRTGASDALGIDVSGVLAPYPGLVSIGTTDRGRILVDLEAAHGVVALHGPEGIRRAALAGLAVELATNLWSDEMEITLVGFGEELSLVAPDRIRVAGTLNEVLPHLESRTREALETLAQSGFDSVLTGRGLGGAGGAWMPHYLISAEQPDAEQAARLAALGRAGGRLAAGYVVAGEVPGAAWRWDVNVGGRLTTGEGGFDVEAQTVPERHYRAVVELFRTAGRHDGGVSYAAASPPASPSPFTPPEPGGAAMGAHAGVEVRILGPVEVEAPGLLDEDRRALCTEVLVYLATHPEGVHPTVLSGAIWPRGVAPQVRDATIARVADWVGQDSRGRPNLYRDEQGRVRLGSEVRIDWDVFRWLIWRSTAEPGAEKTYLSHALDLLRGPLLAGREKGRYAWLAAEDLEYEATARAADIAHRLAMMYLDEGDHPAAVSAARAGLRLAAEDEVLWRDLLRATHATGDELRFHAVIGEIRKRAIPHGGVVQPETESLLEELAPRWNDGGRRPVASGE